MIGGAVTLATLSRNESRGTWRVVLQQQSNYAITEKSLMRRDMDGSRCEQYITLYTSNVFSTISIVGSHHQLRREGH